MRVAIAIGLEAGIVVKFRASDRLEDPLHDAVRKADQHDIAVPGCEAVDRIGFRMTVADAPRRLIGNRAGATDR